MAQVHIILSNVLLVFQLSLGLWQFGKLTPLGGLVKAGMGWLLSLLPFHLSRDYALLQHRPGRVFKEVECLVLTKVPGLHDELASTPIGESSESMKVSYLGDHYQIERRNGNKMFVNGKMTYYITHTAWENLLLIADQEDDDFVFVKGYQRFWKSLVTGSVMTLSEALDAIIVENQTIMLSDAGWLLPVNLSLSEEKLLKILNLVGFFLQTKKVFWLIPTVLSIASAILEFNTTVRVWLYRNINKVFCCSMHFICDKLSYSLRRQLYSLGVWVENLTPCNDIELKIVRGDICALIGGGAKTDKEDATWVPWLNVEGGETPKSFPCDPIVIDPIVIKCAFDKDKKFCCVTMKYSDVDADADIDEVTLVDCNSEEEYKKMCTFVDCMAKKRSGSLKSYDGHKKVEVRGWKESVRHYAKSGYPAIYELNLQNVIVTAT